ncbi:MAG: cytochrome c-type biogenesis protein CcmH, partial [Gemmatimonadota bacterium]|jgi:cytochrome c-type biogenesis protein CcmH
VKTIVLIAIAMAVALSTNAVVTAQDDALTPEERLAEAGDSVVELTPEQESRARSLESEFKCPVCRSQSIRQSRSFMAEDMKRRVRELIAQGRSDDEIREYFIARYGEWILLTPPKRGFSLAAYVLPFLAVVAGAAMLVFAARRWRGGDGRRITPEPPPAPYLERLDKELEETE